MKYASEHLAIPVNLPDSIKPPEDFRDITNISTASSLFSA